MGEEVKHFFTLFLWDESSGKTRGRVRTGADGRIQWVICLLPGVYPGEIRGDPGRSGMAGCKPNSPLLQFYTRALVYGRIQWVNHAGLGLAT